jgi:PleD family two-component response regulator
MTILIVEDDSQRAKDLKKYLQSKMVDVLLAQDGYEALLRLKQYKVDLILSDANMPFMDGFVLAKNVKANSETKTTPFFLYSSRYIPEDTKDLAFELGVDRCLEETNTNKIGEEALIYLRQA